MSCMFRYFIGSGNKRAGRVSRRQHCRQPPGPFRRELPVPVHDDLSARARQPGLLRLPPPREERSAKHRGGLIRSRRVGHHQMLDQVRRFGRIVRQAVSGFHLLDQSRRGALRVDMEQTLIVMEPFAVDHA